MEIWGSGCNIFGQLAKNEEHYLFELKMIQHVDKGNIHIVFNAWSEILYCINGRLKLLGFRADNMDIHFTNSILCAFGTIEISGFVDSEFNLRDLKGNILHTGIGIVVEAGNGQLVGTDYNYKNLIFFDTKDGRFDICNIFSLKLKDENSKILQISAGASHFALLSSDGEVYTWGDNIYGQLGRETSDGVESNTVPTIVSALQGLKIQKIAAGGWMTGAQSADNDLYICGWLRLGKIVNTSDDKSEFNLVDLGENVDILDFGIGSEHIVVLTTNGIYSLGKEGENCLSYSTLIWIQIPQFSNKKITHVFCSQWNTLLITYDESKIEKDNPQS
ncbi:hypothetical protein T552_01779 [Pneumocystis carinii B80]|uniref:Uncharacterized protein n=1 Tax=Pneumocystis carinii (strain B80) TaxID=1408658 RepID=A0A0W4ZJI5_PNEC8|nr:hypothetical protein T552_01779 [Pneumocystis carinii B80]KTW28520.1 hypothetical protein T552_01779 [Pneumocystis carinii B80]